MVPRLPSPRRRLLIVALVAALIVVAALGLGLVLGALDAAGGPTAGLIAPARAVWL